MRAPHGKLPETAKKHMTPDLPRDKSLQDIFADFIGYLFDSTKVFIQEREPKGKEFWQSLGSNIDLILSHPNGWEGREQAFLRKSVVRARVFTEEEALSHVSFVTEGEAAFHFCVTNTNSVELLEVVFFLLNSGDTFQPLVSSSITRSWSSMLEVELSTSALTP